MIAAGLGDAPAGLLRLDRHRIYVLPSGGGIVFLLIALLILLGGMNYNNALAYGLSFLLGGLFVVAIGETWRNLAGLTCLGAQAEPVFAGEPAQFRVSFDNRDGAERLSLELEPRVLRRLFRRSAPAEAGVAFDLPARRLTPIALPIPAPHRGRLRCPRLRLQSRYPLGLVRAWAWIDIDAQCIVYPAPQGSHALPAAAHGEQLGATPLTMHGGVDDFAGLRAYQPGDPPRSIAWKSLARTDQLEVKRFTGGADRSLWLRYEQTAALTTIEQRLGQLCRWLLESQRTALAVGLELPGAQIAPGVGAAHLHDCLRALADVGRA